MKTLSTIAIAISAAIASWLLTGRFRRYALKSGIIDVPNARSSHVTPTPRGGGLAIVITVLVALPILGALQMLPWNIVFGLWGAGAIAAAVGFVDDRTTVGLAPRLFAHFAAAACVVQFIGVAPIAQLFAVGQPHNVAASVISALFLVWMLNLTNFMDGIDGLASVEVVTVCFGGCVCVLVSRAAMSSSVMSVSSSLVSNIGGVFDPHFAVAFYTPVLLGAATIGFLFWNWPPARIFMGDAGSGFLGVLLGALSIIAATAAPQLLWSWLILLALFMVDSTVTLVRRIARGERFYKAHRSHAYQHAAQRWGHQRVTLLCGAINLFWLLPIALSVALNRVNAPIGMALAYVPLAILALGLRAGLPD